MADTFDVIVIGGGSTGENVAGRAVAGGLSAALIERELVGGECSYWACMPSKALLRPGEALAAVRRVPGAREAVTGALDVKKVLERRDAFTSHWDDSGQVEWVKNAGAALVRGHGRLTGPRQVEVTRPDGAVQTLTARKAVAIATGTVAAIPPIPGLAEAQPWDSRQVTSARKVPQRLVILGGGFVGCEMAQAWRWLGAREVTIIEMAPNLLPAEEPFAGAHVAQALAEQGVQVLTGVAAASVKRANGLVTVRLDDGREVTGDELVVATGRRPATADLGLETVGLKPGDYIKVDDQLRAVEVDGGWLYAVGDVNGRALLTHQGKYQARIAADHMLGKEVAAWADNVAVPRVSFTEPQVAAVGLTERQARDRGLRITAVQLPFASTAGAALLGQGVKGTVQVLVDEERRVLVGATFVGPGAGELLHAATIAIVGKVPLERLWHAVPAFPTVSEFWLRLLERYGL